MRDHDLVKTNLSPESLILILHGIQFSIKVLLPIFDEGDLREHLIHLDKISIGKI